MRRRAFPGARAPHVWLAPGRSILDLFGSGFTLLKFRRRGRGGIEAAAAERGLPLAVHSIRDDQAARRYAAPLVLVRPDGMSPGVAAWQRLALIDTVRGAGSPHCGAAGGGRPAGDTHVTALKSVAVPIRRRP